MVVVSLVLKRKAVVLLDVGCCVGIEIQGSLPHGDLNLMSLASEYLFVVRRALALAKPRLGIRELDS